jgi:Ca2+-transporting ATPase
MIPADCILLDKKAWVKCNESSLTGEVENIKKKSEGDCFLLSSCLINECDSQVRALVIGIGPHSQWGKIKLSLNVQPTETPLQKKLFGVVKMVRNYKNIVFSCNTTTTITTTTTTNNNNNNNNNLFN